MDKSNFGIKDLAKAASALLLLSTISLPSKGIVVAQVTQPTPIGGDQTTLDVTPEFINIEKEPLPFNWGDGSDLFYLSLRDSNGNLLGDTLMNSIRYQEDSLTTLSEGRFSPGSGNFLTLEEKYGNILMVLHSGWVENSGNYVRLEGEFFRESMEGGLWDDVINDPSEEEMLTIYSQIYQNMQDFVGSRVRLLQGSGADTKIAIFEVTSVAYIPNDSVAIYEADGHSVVDVAQAFDQINPQAWDVAKNSTNQSLIIATCGWGPENREDWASFSRYVFVLEEVDPSEG